MQLSFRPWAHDQRAKIQERSRAGPTGPIDCQLVGSNRRPRWLPLLEIPGRRAIAPGREKPRWRVVRPLVEWPRKVRCKRYPTDQHIL